LLNPPLLRKIIEGAATTDSVLDIAVVTREKVVKEMERNEVPLLERGIEGAGGTLLVVYVAAKIRRRQGGSFQDRQTGCSRRKDRR
jgi:hypothetical protein